MVERYTTLESLKKKLLRLNVFTPASKELKALDYALDAVLDQETAPEQHRKSFAQTQDGLIECQFRLDKCEKEKEKFLSHLKTIYRTHDNHKLHNKQRISIVGGHATDVKKLKDSIQGFAPDANLKFKETVDQRPPPHNIFHQKHGRADLIIALTGYVGHALTEHVDLIEKESGIPVLRYERRPKESEDLLLTIRMHLQD